MARRRSFFRPRLRALEDRLAPAAANMLISRADPGQFSVAAGGYFAGRTYQSPFGLTEQRSVSADGRYVTFFSEAGNVVAGQVDTNSLADVFVSDRITGTTELISRAAGQSLQAGNNSSASPSISADGRYVAYTSQATDLVASMVPGHVGNGVRNVFLFDRATGTTALVSHRFDAANACASYNSLLPDVTADGQAVYFSSDSVDLVAGFPNPGGGSYAKYKHGYVYDRATGQVTLVDHDAGNPSAPGLAGFIQEVTPDGRYAALFSALKMTPGGPLTDGVFRYDRMTGENSPAMPAGVQLNGNLGNASISADGRWIAYDCEATNLPAGASGAVGQVYLFDCDTGTIILASPAAGGGGAGGNGQSFGPVVSPDGRYVAYLSEATDLVTGFTDGNPGTQSYDAFLYDRLAGATVLVSRQAGSVTASANGPAAISLDAWLAVDAGGAVVFPSPATDLVAGFVDGNWAAQNDLYRFSSATGAVTLLTGKHGSPTHSGGGSSDMAQVTPDGATILVRSKAGDLVAGLADTNGANDAYLYDAATGKMALASPRLGAPPAASAGGESEYMDQSADGRYVTFVSDATNLVAGQVDENGQDDVFLYDRVADVMTLVSRAHGTAATAAGGNGNGPVGSALPTISRDGRYVVYCSFATDLVAGFVDTNGGPIPGGGAATSTDVFLFDRLTGTNTLISRKAGTANVGGNGTSGTLSLSHARPSISDDGRIVIFASQATDLVPGFVDGNGFWIWADNIGADLFAFDRVTGSVELVSHVPGQPTAGGNGFSTGPSVSGDGRFVAYSGSSNNLVPGQTVGGRQVYLYDRQTGSTALVSHRFDSPSAGGNGGSTVPQISRDGSSVVYNSASDQLVAGQVDTNGVDDIFLYDRLTGVNTLVSHAHGSPDTAGSGRSDMTVYNLPTNAGHVSDDGRFVAYSSGAGNLVSGFVDRNGASLDDLYLYDRLTGANVLVSRTAGTAADGGGRFNTSPAVSGDGRFVAFQSDSAGLMPGIVYSTAYSSLSNAYAYDRLTGAVKLLSHLPGQPNVAGNDVYGVINNGDGSAVTYFSRSPAIVAADYNGYVDVFTHVTPPPRIQSIQVGDGSAQRSVVRSLTVTFDQPVLFAGSPGAAFALLRNGVVVGGQWSAVSQNNPSTYTILFTGPVAEFGSLIDGSYRLEVLAAQVSNIGALDGNGDGVGGDDYAFTFHRLFGDADGDRTVGPLDFAALRAAFGSQSLAFDFDNDGDADAADFFQFRRRFGVTV